jgi:hypothetical protein
MAQKNTFTAEQALAALSFFSETFSFERRSQPAALGFDESPTTHEEEKQVVEENEEEWARIRQLIPDWIVGDDDTQDQESVDNEKVLVLDEGGVEASSSPSRVEQLGPDVSAMILSHLSVSEILNTTSFLSKTMHRACLTNELWRTKFVARWNCPSLDSNVNWFEAYKAAYGNSHDLWVTHWNCVSPNDGDSPGRCCIPDASAAKSVSFSHQPGTNVTFMSPWIKHCPTCRYSSDHGTLPPIIQQAINEEERGSKNDDPVEQAEAAAAAHSLLLNENDSLTTRARAVFATTEYAIAKWCRNERGIPPVQSSVAGYRQAFENAATFHRRIDAKQYRSNNLNFLTDVLFFSMVDSHLLQTRQALEEQRHLRGDIYRHQDVTAPGESGTVSSFGPSIETSHHSWHIVRFSNPDYVRPISFRIFVQRPDCFTVFPSEGFLTPGQTCHIVLGVRLLGSLLSEAFEALNVQREEVDPFLADVYAHEAHLPYAPFAVRYVFAPVVPCIPPSFTSRGSIKPSQSLSRPAFTQAATSKYKDIKDYLWENVATESTVRTLYLSAHVHANYRLEDFQRATLSPFDIRAHASAKWGSRDPGPLTDPLVYVAPNLLERDPTVYESLANLKLEVELSDAGQAFRTEKHCETCSRDWGARSEELGRAYILQMLVCDSYARRKEMLMRNVVTAIRQIYFCLRTNDSHDEAVDLDLIDGTLYILHGVLIQKRADCSISCRQRQYLLHLECVVDELIRTVQDRLGSDFDSEASLKCDKKSTDSDSTAFQKEEAGSTKLPKATWRNEGVYKFKTCTDSIFERELDLPSIETDLTFAPEFKDELDYLDGFRYLCHSPGLYCLGQQQDPNHEDPAILPIYDIKTSPFRRVFPRGKRCRNSDTFMDNHTLAFACALSMIHDPRSLLVHGIYDRVQNTIVRRPVLPPIIFNRASPSSRATVIEKGSILVKKWKSQTLRKSKVTVSQHIFNRKTKKTFSESDFLRSCLHYSEPDVDSLGLLHLAQNGAGQDSWPHTTSLHCYLQNIPPPGVGCFSLSTAKSISRHGRQGSVHPDLVPLTRGGDGSPSQSHGTENIDWLVRGPAVPLGAAQHPRPVANVNLNVHPAAAPGAQGNGPRVINVLWLMSAHFGWAVDDSQGAGSVLVDRQILIATQWVSNSLMTLPLLWTLLARYVKWITSKPINYYLEGLPHEVDNEMRYLTAAECGSAAILVLAMWLIMGRYAERRISRSFERAMMEHLSNQQVPGEKKRFLPRTASRVTIWLQRQWDRTSPLFLQRLVFSPRWNHRNEIDVHNHVTAWRSKDLREHMSKFEAEAGQGVTTYGASVEDGGPPIDYKEESPLKKILTGLVVSFGSFSASSPHFFLNLLTVFSCSIALVGESRKRDAFCCMPTTIDLTSMFFCVTYRE